MAVFSGFFAKSAQGGRRLISLRTLIAPAFGLILLVVVARRAGDVDWDAVASSLAQVGPLSVLLAIGLTALSYLAAGQYDALIHRHLQLPYPAKTARRAGMAAIAISQTVGLGLVSGTLVRARLLPAIALTGVTQITLLVATGFTLSWAVLSALSVSAYRGQWGAVIGMLLLLGLILIRLRQFFPEKSPDLATFLGLFLCSVLDCLMAGLGLLVLCGATGFADPSLFLLAFLLAFGAGLMSGTPAGVGAFELVFLTTLSAETNAAVLAGIILWRFVYFVGPAILAAVYGLSVQNAAILADISADEASVGPNARAEALVGLQAGHRGLALPGGAGWLVARCGRWLIGMFDPSDRKTPDLALKGLEARARAEGRKSAAYKVDGRLAATARSVGWSVLEVAREAVVDPTDFSLDMPGRAGLRRKLRRAAAAGVVIDTARASRDRDWQAICAVANEWMQSHGGERGFSMGRVERRHLQRQVIVTARRGDEILAFASFHRNQAEWVLDILRHRNKVEDGTMHALIMGGIDLAAQTGTIRLSLAAAPVTGFQDCPKHPARIVTWLGYKNGAGLAQFKQAFAPRWEPRYLIAPGPFILIEALFAIMAEVHRPRNALLAHDDDEEIGIAPEAGPCDIASIQIDEAEDVDQYPVPERAYKAA